MDSMLIAIEGIDGAGCGTQAERLQQTLDDAVLYTYPDYDHPTGDLLDRFLHSDFDLTPREQLLLYLANMAGDQDAIADTLADGTTVVVDRYVTSTLAYQEVNGLARRTILEMADLLGFRRPDLAIYLDCPVSEANRRKKDEKDELDRYEDDLQNQEEVAHVYSQLADGDVFAKQWATVDASRSIEAVHSAVQEAVKAAADQD